MIWKMLVDIKRAKPADVETLSEVATRSYLDHYQYFWEDGGAADYVAQAYGVATLEKELAEKGNEFYFACAGGVPVGFLKLRPASTLPIFERRNAFEVHRIYLTKEAQGKGVGKALMLFSIKKAKKLGKDIIWLKVMDKTEKPIKFYKSFGFSVCGTETLVLPKLKPELSGMFVMKKDL